MSVQHASAGNGPLPGSPLAGSPLAGRAIVIVGGTTGLGLSAARACVVGGASVVLIGRSADSADRAVQELGDAARAAVGDAMDPATSINAVALAHESFGRFDALYHVAGGSGRRLGDGPLDRLTDDGIQQTLQWNLVSLMMSNRAAVRDFLRHGTAGAVLNMASVLAFSPAPKHFATHVYAAAKAGAIGFTKSCAAYYAAQNIRFNAIAPALVETPMSGRAVSDPSIVDYVRSKQPLCGGRVARPEDLDAAVVYLLSDGARLVTGQVLAVDGGWTVSEGQYER